MQYSQKYTIVAFLEPVESDKTFTMSTWPLHITLADVFAFDLNKTTLNSLAKLLLHQQSISITAGKETMLGKTNVVLIRKTKALIEIHSHIIKLLESNGASFNNAEFTRSGFKPHVTIQQANQLYTGDKRTITTVSLIDMFPDNDWQKRRVLQNFTLESA